MPSVDNSFYIVALLLFYEFHMFAMVDKCKLNWQPTSQILLTLLQLGSE